LHLESKSVTHCSQFSSYQICLLLQSQYIRWTNRYFRIREGRRKILRYLITQVAITGSFYLMLFKTFVIHTDFFIFWSLTRLVVSTKSEIPFESLAWCFIPVILALRKQRQEDCELGAWLGYTARPCLKKKQQKIPLDVMMAGFQVFTSVSNTRLSVQLKAWNLFLSELFQVWFFFFPLLLLIVSEIYELCQDLF
jgi:hypothetical protein